MRIEDIDLFRDFAVSWERRCAGPSACLRFQVGHVDAIAFPEPDYSVVSGDTPDYDSGSFRYHYQSFLTLESIFDYISPANPNLRKRQEVLGGYDPNQYVCERFWAAARDGIKVPVSIVYRKGFVATAMGPFPLWLRLYGFATPASFPATGFACWTAGWPSPSRISAGGTRWAKSGGEDGMLMNKKNTFFDFIDCAEFLIGQKWTSKDRLVIEGAAPEAC